MANLIRSAKSSSDWTGNDLEAYGIVIRFEDAPTFFGVNHMPLPPVDQEVLTTQDADDMVSDRNAELINLLDLSVKPKPAEESAVNDFVVALFTLLGYVKRHRLARTRKNIPLFICGDWRHAKTDVCLIDRQKNEILLLVQEDKRHQDDLRIAQHQLVAGAIAAFDYNNQIREATGQAALESKVYYPII
jgi:hypothetical protein